MAGQLEKSCNVSHFEVDVESPSPVVERDDNDDGISIRIESAIVAKVNGGGPVIRMKSLSLTPIWQRPRLRPINSLRSELLP